MEKKKYSVLVGKNIINDFSNVLEITSPINNKVIGIIPRTSTKQEIDTIFQNAKTAFSWWKFSSINERKNKLNFFANLLEKHKDEIANIMIWEVAKNKKDSLDEIERSIKYIKETIYEYEKMMKSPLIIDERIHKIQGKVGTFIYQPIGVVLAISPFNYPLNLLISKIAPALISGNVVVYKPATQGSCLGAFISNLLYQSGFDQGQVSCLIGKGNEIGNLMIENDDIDMISFTGSTSIGKNIASKKSLIPLVLEMGGKDSAIVLEDANLEIAANEIIKGAFSYNGQRCTAIKRVLANKNIKEKLINLLNDKLSSLSIGSAVDNCDITEMIDKKSLEYNVELTNEAIQMGATTVQKIMFDKNILFPMILDNVSLDSKIAWKEQFGPILPVIEFNNIDEVIDIVNKSEFGLQTSIFTANIDLAKEMALKLECGTVNINKTSSRGPDIFPFGGLKNSGFGLQGIKDSIISMNRIKGIIENE